MNIDVDREEGGIFREEMPQQLMIVCRDQLLEAFTPVYSMCNQKHNPSETFGKCMKLLHSQWTDRDFEVETEAIKKRPRAEEAFRHSFISYVKQTHVDPTSSIEVQVRVTVPNLTVFVRHMLRAASEKVYVYTGRFFHDDADIVQQEHIIKQAIRVALAQCAAEYVIVEEVQEARESVEVPDAAIQPDDSASNISPSTVFTESSVHEDDNPNNETEEDKRSKVTHERFDSKPTRSVITSFDLQDSKSDVTKSEVSQDTHTTKRSSNQQSVASSAKSKSSKPRVAGI